MTALHDIAHHALHPENIVLLTAQKGTDSWPQIKILQWLGVAPIFEQTGDARLEFVARFASPEQLQTCRVDIASEVYALGSTMRFLLTGSAPPLLSGDEPWQAHLRRESLRGLPREVRHLMARMRSPAPEKRSHDPVALAALLEDCLARLEGQPPTRASVSAVPPQESGRGVRRRLVSAGAIAAVLLLIAMLGAAALSSRFGLARPLRNEALSAAVRPPVVRENQSPPKKAPEFVKAAAEVPLKEQPSPVVSLSPTTPEPVPPEEGPPSIAAAESGAQAAVESNFEVAATFLQRLILLKSFRHFSHAQPCNRPKED
ncbi:MAG: hypothetical protein M3Q86_08695 [Verrucomicrobiota bacterium]|nr:hypothetical protein [Verrucomicrobiota bacterium]